MMRPAHLRFAGAAQALGFLTLFGGAATPSPSALAWFPVVGAGMGLVLGGMWWLASQVWDPVVAAALVVAADLALTGMLHLDGLVDSADGLLPPMARARRLEVMADPAAGAFGVGVAVTLLLLRWAALASLAPSVPLLGALWCASRLAMAGFTRSVPYARESGLATAFRDAGRRTLPTAASAVVLGAVLVAWGGVDAIAAVAVLGVTSAAVVGLSVRRLGGFTGDVLGAAALAGETFGLLAAAAHR
ncbi:MAG: adenosylcobinamide-GDP ribazoletransferase [Actinomycetota bacterium]|nr:adenosylcobinamide-GDP ribazoletransferase [Actinomycetota bacterium]